MNKVVCVCAQGFWKFFFLRWVRYLLCETHKKVICKCEDKTLKFLCNFCTKGKEKREEEEEEEEVHTNEEVGLGFRV